MRRPTLPVVLGLLVVMAVVCSSARADAQRGRDDVRLNELQVIGTHNSYHREISEREQTAYETAINTPGDYDAFLASDFPQIGLSARYDSDFVAELPHGGPARCNPVNAPRGCRDERLEVVSKR
jgi:hypothetical protein